MCSSYFCGDLSSMSFSSTWILCSVSHLILKQQQCFAIKDPIVADITPTWTDGKLNDLFKCLELLVSSSWTQYHTERSERHRVKWLACF